MKLVLIASMKQLIAITEGTKMKLILIATIISLFFSQITLAACVPGIVPIDKWFKENMNGIKCAANIDFKSCDDDYGVWHFMFKCTGCGYSKTKWLPSSNTRQKCKWAAASNRCMPPNSILAPVPVPLPGDCNCY